MAVSRQHHESAQRAMHAQRKAKSTNIAPAPKAFSVNPDLFGQPMDELRQRHRVFVSSVLVAVRPSIECGAMADLGDAWTNGRVRLRSELHLRFLALERSMGEKYGPDGFFIAEEDGWAVVNAGEFLMENVLRSILGTALRNKELVAAVVAASPQKPNGELADTPADLAVELLAKDVAALFRRGGGRIPILENNPDWLAGNSRKAGA